MVLPLQQTETKTEPIQASRLPASCWRMSWARGPDPAGGHTGLHLKLASALYLQTPVPRALRHLGPLGKDLGTSSPLKGPSQDKASAPNDRTAAAGPSLAPGPGLSPLSGPSSQVLAAFSSAGGRRLTAQTPANPHRPGLSSDHTPGAQGPEPHSDVMAGLPSPSPAWTLAANVTLWGELLSGVPEPGAAFPRGLKGLGDPECGVDSDTHAATPALH